MRSDYALYTVGVICFILTGIVVVYRVAQIELWAVATVVLGFLFVVLGYYQRPEAATIEAPARAPPAQRTMTAKPQETETVTEAATTVTILTEISGIGEKRAEQLKDVGINRLEDLASASAKDLAAKLKISQKTIRKWIRNAKKLAEKA